MKIWWCQEHEAAGTKQDPEWCDEGRRMNHRHKCRMVPMRLIPEDVEEVIFQTLYNMPPPTPVDGSYEKPVREQARAVSGALDGRTDEEAE